MNTGGAAKQLGLSERTVRRLANEGKLAHLRFDKLYKFEQQHIDEFKARHTVPRSEK